GGGACRPRSLVTRRRAARSFHACDERFGVAPPGEERIVGVGTAAASAIASVRHEASIRRRAGRELGRTVGASTTAALFAPPPALRLTESEAHRCVRE